VQLLDKYAEDFNAGKSPDPNLLLEVRGRLPEVTNPQQFRFIASNLWERYFCIDVELMIAVLRRWLEIEPGSEEAQRALGSYLLAHGPDWDDEGQRLLLQANSTRSATSQGEADPRKRKG